MNYVALCLKTGAVVAYMRPRGDYVVAMECPSRVVAEREALRMNDAAHREIDAARCSAITPRRRRISASIYGPEHGDF